MELVIDVLLVMKESAQHGAVKSSVRLRTITL